MLNDYRVIYMSFIPTFLIYYYFLSNIYFSPFDYRKIIYHQTILFHFRRRK